MMQDWIGLRPTVLPGEDCIGIGDECFVNAYRGDHCDVAYGLYAVSFRKTSKNVAGGGDNKPLYRIKVKRKP